MAHELHGNFLADVGSIMCNTEVPDDTCLASI